MLIQPEILRANRSASPGSIRIVGATCNDARVKLVKSGILSHVHSNRSLNTQALKFEASGNSPAGAETRRSVFSTTVVTGFSRWNARALTVVVSSTGIRPPSKRVDADVGVEPSVVKRMSRSFDEAWSE